MVDVYADAIVMPIASRVPVREHDWSERRHRVRQTAPVISKDKSLEEPVSTRLPSAPKGPPCSRSQFSSL